MRLAVASLNPGKIREIAALLGGVAEVVPAGDVAYPPEGDDYAANAAAKARAAAAATRLPAVADDSGLEVDALGGWPGVRSARIAGDDAARRRLVLERLAGVPRERRGARFVCVAALARPDGTVETFRGEWPGRIAEAERGAGGFGYDPIFVDADGRTAAEMAPAEKDARSHRGRAFRLLAARLIRS